LVVTKMGRRWVDGGLFFTQAGLFHRKISWIKAGWSPEIDQ
jgi:hypothetical protein